MLEGVNPVNLEFLQKLSSGSLILLIIILESRIILQNI